MSSNILKIVGKIFFYILSGILLLYVVISIGLSNIYSALISVDGVMITVALFLTGLATLVRIYKFKMLLHNHSTNRILDIFLSSRIGKEISFLGYFIPLIKRNNRKDGVLKNLIVDRYTEVLSTLLIAFVSCFFVWKNDYLILVLFLSITVCVMIMICVPFINTVYFTKSITNQSLRKALNGITTLQERLKFNSNYIRKIYLLSIFSTLFDFATVFFVFKAYDVSITIFFIPIIWASSGLISMLAFMIIGSTELSAVYLYNFLAGINKAITASFLIAYKLINITILAILFAYVILRTIKGRQEFDEHSDSSPSDKPSDNAKLIKQSGSGSDDILLENKQLKNNPVR